MCVKKEYLNSKYVVKRISKACIILYREEKAIAKMVFTDRRGREFILGKNIGGKKKVYLAKEQEWDGE